MTTLIGLILSCIPVILAVSYRDDNRDCKGRFTYKVKQPVKFIGYQLKEN